METSAEVMQVMETLLSSSIMNLLRKEKKKRKRHPKRGVKRATEASKGEKPSKKKKMSSSHIRKKHPSQYKKTLKPLPPTTYFWKPYLYPHSTPFASPTCTT